MSKVVDVQIAKDFLVFNQNSASEFHCTGMFFSELFYALSADNADETVNYKRYFDDLFCLK